MLGSVGRAIKSTVTLRADAAVFRPPGQEQVQSARFVANDSPRERLFLRDASVHQFPVSSAVGAFINAAAKSGGIENASAYRARRIEQNVSGCGLVHAGARSRPRLSA